MPCQAVLPRYEQREFQAIGTDRVAKDAEIEGKTGAAIAAAALEIGKRPLEALERASEGD